MEDLGLENYESVDKVLNQPEMTPQKTEKYLKKIIKEAEFKRKQISGYKAHITKGYKKKSISEAERQMQRKQLDDAGAVLNEYIKHQRNKLKTMKGSGIKGRGKKKRVGNVCFSMIQSSFSRKWN